MFREIVNIISSEQALPPRGTDEATRLYMASFLGGQEPTPFTHLTAKAAIYHRLATTIDPASLVFSRDALARLDPAPRPSAADSAADSASGDERPATAVGAPAQLSSYAATASLAKCTETLDNAAETCRVLQWAEHMLDYFNTDVSAPVDYLKQRYSLPQIFEMQGAVDLGANLSGKALAAIAWRVFTALYPTLTDDIADVSAPLRAVASALRGFTQTMAGQGLKEYRNRFEGPFLELATASVPGAVAAARTFREGERVMKQHRALAEATLHPTSVAPYLAIVGHTVFSDGALVEEAFTALLVSVTATPGGDADVSLLAALESAVPPKVLTENLRRYCRRSFAGPVGHVAARRKDLRAVVRSSPAVRAIDEVARECLSTDAALRELTAALHRDPALTEGGLAMLEAMRAILATKSPGTAAETLRPALQAFLAAAASLTELLERHVAAINAATCPSLRRAVIALLVPAVDARSADSAAVAKALALLLDRAVKSRLDARAVTWAQHALKELSRRTDLPDAVVALDASLQHRVAAGVWRQHSTAEATVAAALEHVLGRGATHAMRRTASDAVDSDELGRRYVAIAGPGPVVVPQLMAVTAAHTVNAGSSPVPRGLAHAAEMLHLVLRDMHPRRSVRFAAGSRVRCAWRHGGGTTTLVAPMPHYCALEALDAAPGGSLRRRDLEHSLHGAGMAASMAGYCVEDLAAAGVVALAGRGVSSSVTVAPTHTERRVTVMLASRRPAQDPTVHRAHRRHLVEAAIVRAVKRAGPVPSMDLLAAVAPAVPGVVPVDIRVALQALESREYIEHRPGGSVAYCA